MLPFFCTESITRVRPGIKVERGSSVPDWDDDAIDELEITGVSVQPTATSLAQDGRVLGISEQLTAYLPENADVVAGDRIIYNGETYVINGEPKKWNAITRSNIQLQLSRWEG